MLSAHRSGTTGASMSQTDNEGVYDVTQTINTSILSQPRYLPTDTDIQIV